MNVVGLLAAALVVVVATMVLWHKVWVPRIRLVERQVSRLRAEMALVQSEEYWEAKLSIREQINLMRGYVLEARRRGNLDQANKLMEMEHWADSNYEPEWLDGMFRGFP